jgi:hypothetical protein
MIILLRSAEWIAGPQSEEPLEDGSERESGDDVARPVGQDHDTRQREPNRERSDRLSGAGGQSARSRGGRPHVQRMA